MQHTEEYQVPARTETRVVKTTCDLCGKDVAAGLDHYEVDEVTVECSVGTRYPEGTDLDMTIFDLCGACFRDSLVPWLVSQGAQPRKKEISF
jgi:hypothetical protein